MQKVPIVFRPLTGRFSIARELMVVETELRFVSTTGASLEIVTDPLAPPPEASGRAGLAAHGDRNISDFGFGKATCVSSHCSSGRRKAIVKNPDRRKSLISQSLC